MNLIEFEEVKKVIDETREVGVVYIDLTKAFDKVHHGRLTQKIKMEVIYCNLVIWIQKWLNHRRQRVVMEARYSS